jgi:hypothetical protein
MGHFGPIVAPQPINRVGKFLTFLHFEQKSREYVFYTLQK